MSSNPYLLPNFHSISEIESSFNSYHHCFDFRNQLDYNGSGVYGSVCLKRNTCADFYANGPTLPYFINRSREQTNFAAKNCLIHCQHLNKDLLLSTNANKIFGLLLNETKATINGTDRETTSTEPNGHIYSADGMQTNGPFRYWTQKVLDFYAFEDQDFRPIFELKPFQSNRNESEIQSNSRNKICFFRFTDESDSDDMDIELDSFKELNVEDLRRSDETLFENCDRNQVLINRLLISYSSDNVIDLYDLETNSTIRSLDSTQFSQRSDKQIGLQWSQYNPNMFFYGQHQRVLQCDSRAHKPVVEVFDNKNNKNLFQWEVFYQFLSTKLKPNQLFLATDYHILVTDVRYPKNNLIQLNHMLPKTIIRSLKSQIIESTESVTELLITSNFHRNCLMSFKTVPDLIPLSSLHLPLHSSNPKDCDKKFENYFYRGIQAIDSTDKSGFSLALLTNSGDIFVQDFYWNCLDSDGQYVDTSFSSGVGSDELQLKSHFEEYMHCLNNYLYELSCDKPIETVYTKQCLNCTLNRVCKLEANECQCRNLNEFSKAYESSGHQSSTDSTQLRERLYAIHLGPEVVANKQLLENREQLLKTTDWHSKNVLKIWSLLDDPEGGDSQPDPTQANTSIE